MQGGDDYFGEQLSRHELIRQSAVQVPTTRDDISLGSQELRLTMRLHEQFFRYALVGLTSNLLLYLLYLLLTYLGMGHKSAMTGLYFLGVLQTFVLNRNWSFRHNGHVSHALARYLIVYATGYFLNLIVLLLLVDFLGFHHELVQGSMIMFLAVLLFISQRYWVFRPLRPHYPNETASKFL